MEYVPENNENRSLLPFSTPLGSASKLTPGSERSKLEFPELLKHSYSNLLTIEDEYEGLTATEAGTDVKQCKKLLHEQEQEINSLSQKLNQKKSKRERMLGDLEEAEVCLSMAESFEAAIAGWRDTIQIFESLHQTTINMQEPFSLAEQAWEDLKHTEQQALAELNLATTNDVINVPYGSMSVQKKEARLPEKVSIDILGDYLPVSIMTESAQLALTDCQQGTATYTVNSE
ncbi:MAG: hypothetical protein K0U86_11700 [Planctomycetes bacterium]|nr:hypothetical protein [Planctomycetota bacterium]MCH9725547.1 hypothetical protein [Planctomycetota bacterium]MCH9777601.1 hypothetical protein [Planctomycetota bacterium]MCH9789951.1 hypothetical protein [Planctomycetota bacterium]